MPIILSFVKTNVTHTVAFFFTESLIPCLHLTQAQSGTGFSLTARKNNL